MCDAERHSKSEERERRMPTPQHVVEVGGPCLGVCFLCVAEAGSTLQFRHFTSFIVGLGASWWLDCHHFPSCQKSAMIANVCHHTCPVIWLRNLDSGHQACIVNGVYPLNQLLGPDLIVFEITKWHVIFSAYGLFKTVLETHGNASNRQFRWKSASHPWIQIAQSQLSIWVPYNHMNLMRQSERTVVQGWRAQRR